MANLKDLKTRISSVKSTQKITAAMKMVAAAKLRRAQDQAVAARPYGERMERMLGSLAASMQGRAGAPRMLAGTGSDDVHLVVVATADRGLCGGFNGTITRAARKHISKLINEGKTVKILTAGRKGRDNLRRDHRSMIVESVMELDKPRLTFAAADRVAAIITRMFEAGEFDVCTIFYNEFQSAMTQILTAQQLIPLPVPAVEESDEPAGASAVFEYEPDEEEILADLLPRNLSVQIYKALLENAASEQGARMTAMDSATRNAGDMIDRLTQVYNRTRQAVITKELIEIISGAEAL